MHLRDWRLFLEQGSGKEIAVATAPAEVVSHLQAPSAKVWIHHDYVLKALREHDLPLEAFCHLFDVVDRGVSVADKERHVTFFYESPLGWLHLTIKKALASERLYVCTLYKSNAREVARRVRKFSALEKGAT